MTYQIVAVDDSSPGACVDVGLTWNGSDTLTSTEAYSGTSLTLSSTLTGGANTDIALNTDKFTVDATDGATHIAGAITGGAGTDIDINSNMTLDATNGHLYARGDLDIGGDVAINTDKFTIDAATGNTTVAGTLDVTADATFDAAVGFGAETASVTSGAVTVSRDTILSPYGTNATAQLDASLADGVKAGQIKIVYLVSYDTNDMVLTPSNLEGYTTITFDAAHEVAILVWGGTNWFCVFTNATLA